MNRIVVTQMNEEKVCGALVSVNFRYGAGSLPSGAEAFSGLDRDPHSVRADKVVLFSVVYEGSIQEKLSIDLAKPADKFIALERLAVCVGRELRPYFALQRGEFGE